MKTKTIIAVSLASALCVTLVSLRIAVAADATRSPGDVISETIKTEVGRKLRDAGASYDDLQVAVAVKRDSATPFKVTYRGLRNFKPASGTTQSADGQFVMHYIGGGEWQGELGGTQFTVPVGRKDNIDLPFVNDLQVLGEWESVDFVADPAGFDPDMLKWKSKLYLEGLSFLADGKTAKPWWTWTKGVVMHHGDKTASHYEIREVKGRAYLFFEWKNGDVTISGMKPHYYVLKKKPAKDS